MKTAITELLNIEYPIVQGAMAWVADADLASAVSNAGGLGVIGTGHDNVDTVRAKVEAMFAKTDKPFAVNVIEPTCGRSGRLLNRIWRQNHYHWCREPK